MDGSDFDKKLREIIQDMDRKFPVMNWDEEDLWDAIQVRQKKRRQTQRIKISSGIAVGVLLISSVIYFIGKGEHEKITVRYSEVPDTVEKSGVGTNHETTLQVRELIEEQCRSQSRICQSQEFRELKSQFEELENQAQDMDRQLKLFGKDPALLKAQDKIKRIQTSVGRDLIQMLGS